MKLTTCCLRIEFYSQTERLWVDCLSIPTKLRKNLSYIAVVHVTEKYKVKSTQIVFVRNPGNGLYL